MGMSGSELKDIVIKILRSEEFDRELNSFTQVAPYRLISILQSTLCNGDDRVRWHAVTALGMVVACQARDDMEAGRRVIRRLIWTITEESGGIGWGAPEAIAEILARHGELAKEYARLLVSYLEPDGNYLEFEPLREGVLWGIARLAEEQPEAMMSIDAALYLKAYLRHSKPNVRGLAVWALGALRARDVAGDVEKLLDDQGPITVYREARFVYTRVADFAVEALARMTDRRHR